MNSLIDKLEHAIFSHRPWVIAAFMLVTMVMLYGALQLKVDAGFNKLLPLKHEYMQTFVKYQQEFGGANRILVALNVEENDIFTPDFFNTLRDVTDEVFFIPGVDRSRVRSLYTPNVRFTEVVEDGIAGGNIIPADFEPTAENFTRVRNNILKSNYMGRLVANDFSGAIISAELLEINPNTGEKLDYIQVAKQLEDKIRKKYQARAREAGFTIHMIGFAKVIGDIQAGAQRVILFFAITLLVTMLMVYLYTQSIILTLVSLGCSLLAVIWQLGLLTYLGYGIDPMSILVPFLVFAIGVSHGVQMISANRSEIFLGADVEEAARRSFRRLLIPGGIALASDTIGFITILLIEIRIIQEMAITASLGVGAIILTNLVLLPVLISYLKINDGYRQRLMKRAEYMKAIWLILSRLAERRIALVVIAISLVLLIVGSYKATEIKIGDLHRGVPELRPNSRYNLDSEAITSRFSIGVDILSVITESKPEACVDYEVMKVIDEFEWHMRNVEGVQSVVGIAGIAKKINAGWNEGNLKWNILPRNQSVLAQSVTYIDTSTGLLNSDCSVMPVMIFTDDHKAETINRVVAAVRDFQTTNGNSDISFKLATGNVGVMAATNEAVEDLQYPILFCVFTAIIILCLITFRTFAGMLCIVLPLALVSVLAYALMALLDIGLKVSTLPVVALGVGIGVDYGIYIFSRFQSLLKTGKDIKEAYFYSLQISGNAVLFTGMTLGIGVCTWMFSPLKFQADMGILLTFMFLVNMLGAIFLLPALATWMLKTERS